MMTTFLYQFNYRATLINRHNQQRGIVLFIALVALVVMSLAAAGLIRSVDTNTAIAGNLSYKQNALLSGANGSESIMDALGVIGFNKNGDEGGIMPPGYHASCLDFDQALIPGANTVRPCNGALLTSNATWNAGVTSSYATGTNMTSGGKDVFGNTVEYIVERMCNFKGDATTIDNEKMKCLYDLDNSGEGEMNDSSMSLTSGLSIDDPDNNPFETPPTPIYRITVRIIGPKNTTSYLQTFIS